jgi:hypothetical protein
VVSLGPFPQTTTYRGDANKVWMLNFCVRHLGAMVKQLRSAGSVGRSSRSSTPTVGSLA